MAFFEGEGCFGARPSVLREAVYAAASIFLVAEPARGAAAREARRLEGECRCAIRAAVALPEAAERDFAAQPSRVYGETERRADWAALSQAPVVHADASAAVLVSSWHRTTSPAALIVHKWTSGESIHIPVALTLA